MAPYGTTCYAGWWNDICMKSTLTSGLSARRAIKRAFTLAELLVVIGIISILIAISMAAVSRSKVKAQRLQCLNNNRNIAFGWTLAAEDQQGQMLSNVDGFDYRTGTAKFTNWVSGNLLRPQDRTNGALLLDRTLSEMSPYVSNPKTYKCPGDRSNRVRSYAVNCRMNPLRWLGPVGWIGGGGAPFRVFRKLSDVALPSETFLSLDERSDTINDAFFATDMSNTGDYFGMGPSNPFYIIDYPASYHSGAATVSFADGHVAPQAWRAATTLVPLGQAVPRLHTATNDVDTEWLQAHATTR